ncbi:hypothetical protein [Chryseobacterium limigenitum]|uniref:NVEALA protein n=1 Tax=Chryseobacterium limigenitum TaxID=1612149 RepID=A0A1K2IV43_9FLAO|nr:hypothetical protein [Chryseobacterium limigenitum]SFZ95611.1 hypothetical protein SAMN05216324_11166 [Chryseobacterium limigenitum]
MKKMILLAAFVGAGLVNAKSTVVKNSDSKETKEVKENSTAFGCIQIFIQTSCGLNSNTTWCSEWGIDCLMSDAEAVEQINCHQ